MQTIDWNQMSKLGLIEKINREILHPMGLAISRNPKTGTSDQILVAPDGFFEYDIQSKMIPENEIHKVLDEYRDVKRYQPEPQNLE